MNWRRKRKTWELAQAGWGGHEVFLHLTEGWEPFAISTAPVQGMYGTDTQVFIWFRREVRS